MDLVEGIAVVVGASLRFIEKGSHYCPNGLHKHSEVEVAWEGMNSLQAKDRRE